MFPKRFKGQLKGFFELKLEGKPKKKVDKFNLGGLAMTHFFNNKQALIQNVPLQDLTLLIFILFIPINIVACLAGR